MGDAQVVRLLVFRVGNLTCAAAAEVVREILPRLPTTRIPGAPPVVAGLVNVRGTLVTVVEGWKALGQPEPAERTEGGTTVLLQIAAALGPRASQAMLRKVAALPEDVLQDCLTALDRAELLVRIDSELEDSLEFRRSWCGRWGVGGISSSWCWTPTRYSAPC